jgi:formylglycine-generating enzyme required for sulfatase activity
MLYGCTTAVGCFPTSINSDGLLDMAGNVWEWTRSAYKPYPYDPADGRESESSPTQKRFTLRGGGWLNPPMLLRAPYRHVSSPDNHYYNVGMRLARHPLRVKR